MPRPDRKKETETEKRTGRRDKEIKKEKLKNERSSVFIGLGG